MMISFGALADPLHKQLRIPAQRCKTLQADADAVARLKIRGLITDSVAHSARKKLMRDIEQLFGEAYGEPR